MALRKLEGSSTYANAIRAVVLVGNPLRTPNLKCDYDTEGGRSTASARGLQAFQGGLSSAWDKTGRVIDACAPGDNICGGGEGGYGGFRAHLSYGNSAWVQKTGAALMIKGFKSSSSTSSSKSGAAPLARRRRRS